MNKVTNYMVPLALLMGAALFAQEEQPKATTDKKALRASRELTYKANKELKEEKFVQAEAGYRRAMAKDESNIAAPYNLGTAYYEKESLGEAFSRFKQASELATAKTDKHRAFHNLGNVFMKNKDYQQAVEAYKDALRNNPEDEETRYNLALAKEMLKQEQQQQKEDGEDENQEQQDQQEQNQDQQDQGQNEDQNQDQQEQEGENGDEGEEEKEENKEGEGDEKQEEQKQPEPGDQEEKKPPRPNQLSPQQIENLLEAMQNEEKKVQEKLDAQKQKGRPVKNKKDW